MAQPCTMGPVQARITSHQNPAIREAAKLRKRRQREKSGHILIDGHRALALAVTQGVPVVRVLLCPELATAEAAASADAAKAAGAGVVEVAAGPFAKLAYGDAPDGVVAVAHRPETGLSRLAPSRPDPLLVVAERLEKPGNLGAILRTADGAGADGVICCDPTCDPFGPNVVRASRGTVFSLPLAEADVAATTRFLRGHGIPLVAATPDASIDYTSADLTGPMAIAVGEEHGGLSEALMTAARIRLRLPMRGSADSLNVSAACAVLLYEAVRQREAAA